MVGLVILAILWTIGLVYLEFRELHIQLNTIIKLHKEILEIIKRKNM